MDGIAAQFPAPEQTMIEKLGALREANAGFFRPSEAVPSHSRESARKAQVMRVWVYIGPGQGQCRRCLGRPTTTVSKHALQ